MSKKVYKEMVKEMEKIASGKFSGSTFPEAGGVLLEQILARSRAPGNPIAHLATAVTSSFGDEPSRGLAAGPVALPEPGRCLGRRGHRRLCRIALPGGHGHAARYGVRQHKLSRARAPCGL